jgi:hypothetical protein
VVDRDDETSSVALSGSYQSRRLSTEQSPKDSQMLIAYVERLDLKFPGSRWSRILHRKTCGQNAFWGFAKSSWNASQEVAIHLFNILRLHQSCCLRLGKRDPGPEHTLRLEPSTEKLSSCFWKPPNLLPPAVVHGRSYLSSFSAYLK